MIPQNVNSFIGSADHGNLSMLSPGLSIDLLNSKSAGSTCSTRCCKTFCPIIPRTGNPDAVGKMILF